MVGHKIVDNTNFEVGKKYRFIKKKKNRHDKTYLREGNYVIIGKTDAQLYERNSNPGVYVDIYDSKGTIIKKGEFALIYVHNADYSSDYSPELCFYDPEITYNLEEILNNLDKLETTLK